jgi:hypothetical protein
VELLSGAACSGQRGVLSSEMGSYENFIFSVHALFGVGFLRVAYNGQVLTQWRQQRSNSIGPFTYTKLRVHHFSLIFTFALQTLIQLTDVALPMVRPPAAIAPIPLLAAAAMTGAVPSARVAAADVLFFCLALFFRCGCFARIPLFIETGMSLTVAAPAGSYRLYRRSVLLLQSGAFS